MIHAVKQAAADKGKTGFASLIISALRPILAAYFTDARDDAGISFQNLQLFDQGLGYLEVQTA